MLSPPVAKINPPGVPIERGKIHEFACSIYDDNPLYHDLEAAKAAGLPSVVAPPTYTSVQAFFFDPKDAGALLDSGLDLDLRFVLHGGQEFYFERPIFAGDVLTAHQGEMRTYEKEGKRGGLMKFAEMESYYTDENNEVVLRVKNILIQTAGVVKK